MTIPGNEKHTNGDLLFMVAGNYLISLKLIKIKQQPMDWVLAKIPGKRFCSLILKLNPDSKDQKRSNHKNSITQPSGSFHAFKLSHFLMFLFN